MHSDAIATWHSIFNLLRLVSLNICVTLYIHWLRH